VDSGIAAGMKCVTVNIIWKILHSRWTVVLQLEWSVLQWTLSARFFFWLVPPRNVIQYKYQPNIFQFIQNTSNNLLSIYISGKIFRLIEPSSVQFTHHTEGTFIRCAHCEIPNVYKSYNNERYKWQFGRQYIL